MLYVNPRTGSGFLLSTVAFLGLYCHDRVKLNCAPSVAPGKPPRTGSGFLVSTVAFLGRTAMIELN